MQQVLTLIAVLLLTLLASCDKEADQQSGIPEGGALIIASSFGHCAGNCLNAFLVSSEGVKRDDGEEYFRTAMGDWKFQSTPLAGVDALLLDSILTMIPDNIDNFEPSDFGCPDCGDWGALPLAMLDEEGEVIEQYILDNATANMSPTLEAYGQLMQRAIREWGQ